MAELPSIPNDIARVTAPKPPVSPGQIAQPYNELASTMDKAGDVLNKDVAVPLAEQAGLQAVTRDAEGNLQVARVPMVGDAAVAFKRAVSFSALSMGEAEAKRKDLALSKQFPNDPDSYLKAAEAFRDQHVKQFTDAAGPEVGAALGKSIDNNTTTNYRFLLLQQQRNIKANFDKDTKSAIRSLDEDIISLIETGATEENSPELKAKINERHRITHERVTNPVLSASPGEARLDLKQFDAGVNAAKFVKQVNDTLTTKGVSAADKSLDDMMADQSIAPHQRVLNLAQGQKAIKDFLQNQERQVSLANKAQKAADEDAENLIIQDTASGRPGITENDIKTSNMSPGSKMRMLSWIKRDGMPEPLSHISQANAMDLFRRMNLPDGDPNKITDLRPIRDAYAPPDGGPGNLKREDEEWLEKRFVESRSPEGSTLNQLRQQLTKASGLDKSDIIKGPDQTGKMAQFQYEQYVEQRIEEYRKGGKNPMDLLDPSKPDFLGKPEIVSYFKTTVEEEQKALIQRFRPGARPPTPPGLVTPATPPPKATERTISVSPSVEVPAGEPLGRKPGESAAQYIQRLGIK